MVRIIKFLNLIVFFSKHLIHNADITLDDFYDFVENFSEGEIDALDV
ncbi:hypothetical protein [Treponema berlinense]|nr:hypothetical protein [Treponema berlinense]